jgi:glycosyltransferase involved in cell wall biosynthesis
VVDPDRTGVLVRPKDPRALAEAISALLADPERRRRLGAAGRTKAHAEFGHGKMVERTVAVYQQVLAAKGLL